MIEGSDISKHYRNNDCDSCGEIQQFACELNILSDPQLNHERFLYMTFIKLLLISTIVSIIPGQLVRLSVAGNSGAITICDIFVLITTIVFLIYSLAIKKSLKLDRSLFIPFVVFTSIAMASLIFAAEAFSIRQLLVSSLFLIRFIAYFLFSIVVASLIKKNEVSALLNIFLTLSAIFAALGFLQFILFSDLTFLASSGWDPHQRRIVSTFLDPNFAGGYLTIACSIAVSMYLFTKKKIYLLHTALFLTALLLTFSRSTYLAVLTVFIVIGLLKSPKILAAFLFISLITIVSVNQVRDRIIGAITVDETSQARIESWQKAIVIFRDNPLLGVGFNTYRFAQERYGFFSFDEPEGGHSGAGTDSSVLLVLATTGVFGLVSYVVFLKSIFKKFLKGYKRSPLHLGSLASFTAIIVHSQFVNSLFYPQIMLSLFLLLGLVLKSDN